MSQLLRQGWEMMKRHFKLVIVLFLYQLIWAFVLYRTVDHIITPLMKRYPDLTSGKDAITLFWMENQFQLLKTDLIVPYLYALLIMLLIRMLITPFLQAGLLHSIHQHAVHGKGTYFRKGIAAKWKPITLLYWLKNLLIALPIIIYAWPIIGKMAGHANAAMLSSYLNWNLVLLIIWALLVQALFYLLQLAIAWEIGVVTTMKQTFKHAISFLAVSLVIVVIYILASAGVHTLSVLWVSFISFLLYQVLPLLRSMCKVWLLASQYKAIESK